MMRTEKVDKLAVKLHQTFDARVWAEEFVKAVELNPQIATDEGTMIAWFANAIMVGYDHARREERKRNDNERIQPERFFL